MRSLPLEEFCWEEVFQVWIEIATSVSGLLCHMLGQSLLGKHPVIQIHTCQISSGVLLVENAFSRKTTCFLEKAFSTKSLQTEKKTALQKKFQYKTEKIETKF